MQWQTSATEGEGQGDEEKEKSLVETSCTPNYKMFCYQGWKTGNLSILVLVDLLDQSWVIFTFVHPWYMLPGETQTLSQQKSDAIYICLGSCLEEEGLLSCSVKRKEHLWPSLPSPWLHHLGSWRHPWFLRRAWFPCPCFYPWPPLSLGFDHHLNRVIRKAWKVENLKFLENSKICKVRKNDSPRAPYIEGKI